MKEHVGIKVRWTIKERRNGIWVPVFSNYNKVTDDGLTELASATGGGYVAPVNLVIENGGALLGGTVSIGATTFNLASRVDQVGDTQLVMSAGLANQEVVTFSSVTGSGPYTYHLTSATTKAHLTNELVARQTRQADTMSSVTSEVQYDATGAPGQRVASSVGFSGGVGLWTQQFYIPGTLGLFTFTYLGLSDSNSVGAGLLHTHLVSGYVHNSGFDVEVDANWTLANV